MHTIAGLKMTVENSDSIEVSDDNTDEMETEKCVTVYLKNNATAQVEWSELDEHLKTNADNLEPRYIKPRGKRRIST
jgi:hypothetical protein